MNPLPDFGTTLEPYGIPTKSECLKFPNFVLKVFPGEIIRGCIWSLVSHIMTVSPAATSLADDHIEVCGKISADKNRSEQSAYGRDQIWRELELESELVWVARILINKWPVTLLIKSLSTPIISPLSLPHERRNAKRVFQWAYISSGRPWSYSLSFSWNSRLFPRGELHPLKKLWAANIQLQARWIYMTDSVTELLGTYPQQLGQCTGFTLGTGFEPHELIGKPSLELVHPDEFPRVRQLH